VPDPAVPNCGARLAVDGGKVYTLDFPLAEDENSWSTEGAKDKFRSLAGPVLGDKRAEQVVSVVYEIENKSTGGLMAVL
jgi:hypothetical protein